MQLITSIKPVVKTVLFCLSVSGTTCFGQVAEKPVFRVGNSWEWVTRDNRTKLQTDQTRLAVTQSGDTVRLKAGDEAQPSVSWDADGRMTKNTSTGASRVYSAPVPWPLAVGTKWKSAYEWANTSGSKGRTSEDVEVVGLEEVKVPAGTFQGTQTTIRWYVPELRVSVKSTYDDRYTQTTTELVSFKE